MKLLGWMHRKFRQNGGEPNKDFVIGRPSLDQEQNCYQLPKPTHYVRPRRSSHSQHKDTFFCNSFAGIDEACRDKHDHDDPTDCAADEAYHGLLAIGTLGSDPVDHNRISIETVTEKQQTDDVTADDLKLINDELEKELAKDDEVISSARNSHVSSIKQMEGSGGGEGNVNGGVAVAAVCPLQEYLFGSAVELPEATTAAAVAAGAKKEHRTSLGELFMRSRLAEENGGGKVQGKSEQQQQQEKVRDHQVVGVQRVKKMLKRRTTMPIGSASKSTGGGGGGQSMAAGDSFSAKILHIFHRKVHPENSTATKKSSKQESYVVKDSIHCDAGGEDGGSKMLPEHDTIIIPQRVIGKDGVRRRGNHFSSSAITLSGSDSNGNREYWIKTDADYLVLEL